MSEFNSENIMPQISPNYSIISQLSDNEEEDKVENFNNSFNVIFHNIFSTKKNNDDMKEIDENLIYFTNNSNQSISKKTTEVQISQAKKELFKIENKLTQKKRGRKCVSNILFKYNTKQKTHDKNA